jgi:hypothetical protein
MRKELEWEVKEHARLRSSGWDIISLGVSPEAQLEFLDGVLDAIRQDMQGIQTSMATFGAPHAEGMRDGAKTFNTCVKEVRDELIEQAAWTAITGGVGAIAERTVAKATGKGFLSKITGTIGGWVRGLWGAKGMTEANRIMGARAVDDFIARARACGMEVLGRDVTFKTPFGARRMDVILKNPQTGLIGGVEIKSSVGALNRFDAAARQQFSADRWINTFGAQGAGRHSDMFIDNTVKILWPAPAP